MSTLFRPRTLVLFVGDLVSFAAALWVSLWVRAFEVPPQHIFIQHLEPFSLLFVAWVFVYFVAGLYESRSIILARRALSGALLVAQIFNIVIAALFFFFIPLFGIAPKTLLVIYLIVSFLFVLLWRVGLFPLLGLGGRERTIVVGNRQEIAELTDALRGAPHAPAHIVATLDAGEGLGRRVREALKEFRARVVIADFNDPAVAGAFPDLYNLLAEGVRFFDSTALYEQVFGRIVLSQIDDSWVARNVSRVASLWYDSIKRMIDIIVALPAAVVSLVVYPFIMLAIKLEDGGEAIISMPRIGEGGRVFPFYKFRSMSGNDAANYGVGGTSQLHVTKVGSFIRVSRLDELPQLWSVLKGDLSLIGPRPEAPALVEQYQKEIPYYGMRHLIKPGLSGWAQLYHDNHPHHGTAVDATREKFSYDLYYLKHRSLLLDVTIILKTIKKLLTRSGV